MAVLAAVQVLNFILYVYVRYKCKTTYLAYCINQAQLNLTSRIFLEHCIKLAATILHTTTVHCICFAALFSTLYGLVLLQNYSVIRQHHADFEALFNQGSVMVFLVMYAAICIREIPALGAKFLTLCGGWKCDNADAPTTVTMLMNQEIALKRSEGDLRFERLARQWSLAYPPKRKETNCWENILLFAGAYLLNWHYNWLLLLYIRMNYTCDINIKRSRIYSCRSFILRLIEFSFICSPENHKCLNGIGNKTRSANCWIYWIRPLNLNFVSWNQCISTFKAKDFEIMRKPPLRKRLETKMFVIKEQLWYDAIVGGIIVAVVWSAFLE